MELKVGMYVRTKNNGICKLYREFHEDSVDVGIGVFPEIDGFFIDKEEINYIEKDNILKSNENIIDLIEENDILKYEYDNKICVSKVEQCGSIKMLRLHLNYEVSINCVKILEIQTKEQFENNVYRIGE